MTGNSGGDLAAAIAAFPGLAARLQAEHKPGPDGRCTRCTVGGQAGYQRWPCRIHDYATAALDIPPPTAGRP